jgi:hypothetical protein
MLQSGVRKSGCPFFAKKRRVIRASGDSKGTPDALVAEVSMAGHNHGEPGVVRRLDDFIVAH